MDCANFFCERLRAFAAAKGVTQKAIAEALKLHPSVVGVWFKPRPTGPITPTVANLVAVAELLDVSIDYLLGRCDNPLAHKSRARKKPTMPPSK